MKRFGLAVAAVLALLLLVFLPAIVVAEAPSVKKVTFFSIWPENRRHVRVELRRSYSPSRDRVRICDPEGCFQAVWSLGQWEGVWLGRETTSLWLGEGEDPTRVWGIVSADLWRLGAGITFSRVENETGVSVTNVSKRTYRVRTGEGLEVDVLPDQEFVFRGGLCGIVEVWESKQRCLLQFVWGCNSGLADWPEELTPTPTLTQLPLFKKIRLPLILSGKSPKPRATPTLTLTHLPLATPTCTPTATPQIEFAPLRRWR